VPFYRKGPVQQSTTRVAKGELILCVGWHAFINWPQSGRMAQPVPIADDRGQAIANDLRDGQEVEIVAWRPHSREGLAYQGRRLSDGGHWWIRAMYLRRAQTAEVL
jgi:hypothetical protein